MPLMHAVLRRRADDNALGHSLYRCDKAYILLFNNDDKLHFIFILAIDCTKTIGGQITSAFYAVSLQRFYLVHIANENSAGPYT